MNILLNKNLEHQIQAVNAVVSVFENVDIYDNDNIYSNPINCFVPDLIARDGTRIINLFSLYRLCNSYIVFVYT